MPVAVLTSSCYSACEKLPNLPDQTFQLGALETSFIDAGGTVQNFEADATLFERVQETLADHELSDAVCLFFSGYVGLSRQGKPALLLDAPERPGALGFEQLHFFLESKATCGVIILDVVFVASGSSADRNLQTFVAALREVHARRFKGIDALVFVRRGRASSELEPSNVAAELGRHLQSKGHLDTEALRELAEMGQRDGMVTALLGPPELAPENLDSFDGTIDFADGDAPSERGPALTASPAATDFERGPALSQPAGRADFELGSLPPPPPPPPGAMAPRVPPPPPPVPAFAGGAGAALAPPSPLPPAPLPLGARPLSVPAPPPRSPGLSPPPTLLQSVDPSFTVPAARPPTALAVPAPPPASLGVPAPPLMVPPPPPPVAARPAGSVPPPRNGVPVPPAVEAAALRVPAPPRTNPPPAANGEMSARGTGLLSLPPPPPPAGAVSAAVPPPPPPVVRAKTTADVPPPDPNKCTTGTHPGAGARGPARSSELPLPRTLEPELRESRPPATGPEGLPSIIVAPHADKPEEERPPPTPQNADEAAALAARYESAGQPQAAANEYLRALYFLGAGTSPLHAALLVRLGRQQQQCGDLEAALASFGHAFTIAPGERAAVDATLEVLVSQREFERAEKLLRMHLKAVASDAEKEAILAAIVHLWSQQAGEPARSLPALKRWVTLRPSALEAWQQQISIEDALGNYADAIQTRRRLVAQLSNNAERAHVLLAAAEIASTRLGDPEQGLALAREALEFDPVAPQAVELCARHFRESEDWAALAALYDRALAHGSPDAAAVARWARELAKLCTEQLNDPERALRAYECALATGDADPTIHSWLANVYETRGELARAAAHCRALVRSAPLSPQGYRNAYTLFHKTGAADAAWNAVSVLECLGEADLDESLLADVHKPEGLLPVTQNLNFTDWASGELTPRPDPALAVILRDGLEAAINAKLERLRKSKALPELSAAERQDPESTTTLSRSLIWTSKVLGVAAPALYVSPNGTASAALSVVPAVEPSAIADRSLGSGLSLKELAFLWGRHLSLYCREHQLLAHYPNDNELADLMHAISTVCDPQRGAQRALDGEAKRLAAILQKTLSDSAKETIRRAIQGRSLVDLTKAIFDWAERVRVIGARAGLLACGDVAVAAGLARRFPTGLAAPEQQVADLLGYAITSEYTALRQKLGVAVQS